MVGLSLAIEVILCRSGWGRDPWPGGLHARGPGSFNRSSLRLRIRGAGPERDRMMPPGTVYLREADRRGARDGFEARARFGLDLHASAPSWAGVAGMVDLGFLEGRTYDFEGSRSVVDRGAGKARRAMADERM